MLKWQNKRVKFAIYTCVIGRLHVCNLRTSHVVLENHTGEMPKHTLKSDEILRNFFTRFLACIENKCISRFKTCPEKDKIGPFGAK